jgi:ATP-dependent Lon protease
MKDIISYTNKLTKVDINKLSLEQRICLMKTDDLVKEKAMVKLKEVKMKSEDTGSKAIHYLEGLLKIPFGIYKEEPILRVMQEIINDFSKLVSIVPFNKKQKYSGIELRKYMPLLKTTVRNEFVFSQFKILVAELPKNKLIEIQKGIKSLITMKKITYKKMSSVGKSLPELRTQLIDVVEDLMKIDTAIITDGIVPFINQKNIALVEVDKHIHTIDKGLKNIKDYMSNVSDVLNNSVYGHTKAKRQIERIIGQWINGDSTGYCFGFEGPPGVGKTSLAKKGISYCLKDEEGHTRPFSFIAMGGSTNSSTLDGHNYTYVGSTWGRIVDILMDTKIMNPIIFIDELDKVSKTENGKEIIGILTHLVDQTQNDSFQDKYFNGINLNLSRALFIFSYNDAELIDRILLDRIHRIKFEHLSLEDKLIITRKFILPEIYKKMGLVDMIEISDAVIEFIINAYTSEPGVRKLKELMFEIVGEINLAVLKNDDVDFEIPMVITADDIKNKYLKERTEVKLKKIHETSAIGVINGLWANSMGKGGVLPIEASFYPSSTFLDLKLTGMQGNVMKESMEVAKSLAWSIFAQDVEHCTKIKQKLEENKCQGLHIHVPEGATPKDGPSAGTAITMVMYSLFSGRKIKNEIAITGEICLQGRVTAIGGLDLKILGGICAGVKMFIYPKENQQDFLKFMEKYGANDLIKGITFVSVETYEEVIHLIFE